ncbi:MAG: hypothetical protein WCT10_04710 [Patescibacteria group bacterium]
MKYLKISNRGSFNRKYLELIGLSTKRDRLDDPTVIGFKGSGTKLAAVAALRLGLRVAIASSDYLGRYLLSYEIEEVDIDGLKVKQVFFNYDPYGLKDGRETSERFPSQLTIDAFADWDQPIGDDRSAVFKVLREFVCNAADAGEFSFALVDGPACVEAGETAVYLLYTPEIQRLFAEVERYFKFLHQPGKRAAGPVCEVPGIGRIYLRSDPRQTRLYVLGVLVDCFGSAWREALYDYSLDLKTLISEERVVKSFHKYQAEVGRLLSGVADVDVAASILAAVKKNRAPFEELALGTIRSLSVAGKQVWLKAAQRVFGAKIAVGSGNKVIDLDCAQIYGYEVVSCEIASLGTFLRLAGVPRAATIVPPTIEPKEYELVDFIDLDEASRQRFELVWSLFVRHFPERVKWPVAFFHPLSDGLKACAGFAGSGHRIYQEIWLRTQTRTSLGTAFELLRTLVHESRHCLSRADDYDRSFVGLADEEVTRLIFQEAGIYEPDPGDQLPRLGDDLSSRIRPRFISRPKRKA